jgi:magnesium-transporting ATPase (P-type)
MDRNPGASGAWHSLAPEEVLAALGGRARGLTSTEAAQRLLRYGRNALPAAPRPGPLARFLRQFHSVLIYVLLAAAIITAGLGHLTDAAVILGVVLVNAVIGFVQEGKAEAALEAVRAMLPGTATVLRDNERRSIAAADLVPGDVVLLEAGERVPADLRLLHAKNLRVQEAALTGESAPSDKSVEPAAAEAPLAERGSMAYSGTVTSSGLATGVVCATGANTELGRIGTMVAGVGELATPLARKLDRFARALTAVILAAAAALFLFGQYVRSYPPVEMFLMVVGLAVAAIPEGLPAIVTIALAVGTRRMARRHAIVRRLPAVETLGAVTVVCTDKTGTLTRNEMTVAHLHTPRAAVEVSGAGYAPEGGFSTAGTAVNPERDAAITELLRAGLLCNDAGLRHTAAGWEVLGDPTEGALVSVALKAGLDRDAERAARPRIDEVPFDSQYRFMATLHHDHHGNSVIYLKGAPERVLELCAAQGVGREPLERALWEARVREAGARGERVPALAVANAPRGSTGLAYEDIGPRFTLLGLACMIDPPRPEAIAAVAECRSAGVRVLMVTGDHAATAQAIGSTLGVDGVVSRASPEEKLRLVRSLQREGEIVAMTGDGVNDAPALKAAPSASPWESRARMRPRRPRRSSSPTTTSPPSPTRCAKAA